MKAAYRRHDIPDRVWELLESFLPGRKGTWGGNARDNRQCVNAVFWILRTSAPWRDLTPDYGDWKNTHRRFCRWRDKGIWGKLLEMRAGREVRRALARPFRRERLRSNLKGR